jgi:hypothetical protein
MARRSSQEWQKIIEQQEASDLSVVDFCRQQQLNSKYFYARRRSVLVKKQRNLPVPFIKVSKAPTDNAAMALQVGDIRLSLPANTEPEWLAQLLKALSA